MTTLLANPATYSIGAGVVVALFFIGWQFVVRAQHYVTYWYWHLDHTDRDLRIIQVVLATTGEYRTFWRRRLTDQQLRWRIEGKTGRIVLRLVRYSRSGAVISRADFGPFKIWQPPPD